MGQSANGTSRLSDEWLTCGRREPSSRSSDRRPAPAEQAAEEGSRSLLLKGGSSLPVLRGGSSVELRGISSTDIAAAVSPVEAAGHEPGTKTPSSPSMSAHGTPRSSIAPSESAPSQAEYSDTSARRSARRSKGPTREVLAARRIGSFGDVVDRSGAFSSFVGPSEVEFRGPEGDLMRFARNGKGKLDFYVNGQPRIRNITSLIVRGLTLHFDGTGSEGNLVPETVALESHGLPSPSLEELLKRLDRDSQESERDADWSDAGAIVNRILALYEGPDSLAEPDPGPFFAEETLAAALEAEQRVLAAVLDMTPEGFRVESVDYEVYGVPKSGESRKKHILKTGMYFFFDHRPFPDFWLWSRAVAAEQWRGGRIVWTGEVFVVQGAEEMVGGGTSDCTAMGCRYPRETAEEGQWQAGDTVFVLGFHQDKKAFASAEYKDNLLAFQRRLGCEPPEAGEAPGSDMPRLQRAGSGRSTSPITRTPRSKHRFFAASLQAMSPPELMPPRRDADGRQMLAQHAAPVSIESWQDLRDLEDMFGDDG